MVDTKKEKIAKQKNIFINIIRALSLLLLAVLLIIFAAFAWFGTATESEIAGTSLAISGSELTVRENEDDENAAPTMNGKVYLPAATKKDDGTISESDFSKVLAYKSYTVTSVKSGYVKVNVTKPSTSGQLHYVVTDTVPSNDNWAAAIKGGTVTPDLADTYVPLTTSAGGNYEAQVYLILYGDYADAGKPITSFPDMPRSDAQGTRSVQFGSLSLDFAYSSTDTPEENP